MIMTVRVRIAPSPTGDPHVGTAYIALFNMAFAKANKGTFVLRIEDTDQNRSRTEYEENIYKALHWCNIHWDEGPDVGGPYGPYRQSERFHIYEKYAHELVKNDKAYYCFATEEELSQMREVQAKTGARTGYDRRYRYLSSQEVEDRLKRGEKYVIRLKVPLNGECSFEDLVKGRITLPWSDVDDQVLLKSDGFPTYHLANVVDDYLMKITHVIRGDEWISSTPKHLLLYEFFGWQPPLFLHMPLLLGQDGRKLSKRRNPTSIFYYRDSGYLSEALMNFLSLMGFSLPGDQEVYPIQTLIEKFDMKRIGLSGAVFDLTKLNWLNQHYLVHQLSSKDLLERLKGWQLQDSFLEKLCELCHTRIKNLSEFFELSQFLFIQQLALTTELLCPKEQDADTSCAVLQAMVWCLDELENWTSSGFEAASKQLANRLQLNHKKQIMPVLFGALMARKSGLPLFASMDLLGKDRARARLIEALQFLGGISTKRLKELEKTWKASRLIEAT
jgi:glutamyl-tRNA synthetase